LKSNADGAQATGGTTALTAYNSDGFTMGADGAMNTSDATFVTWMWDAGTAANTTDLDDGTINISSGNQWVNAEAGFSLTKYAGNNTADATLSHGLAVPPKLIIIKCLSGADGSAGSHWIVKHIGLSMTNTSSDSHMYLNMNNAASTNSNDHGTVINHASDNTLVQFKVGSGSPTLHHVNGSHDYIMYCWTAIPGYSAFGSYEGTGNASTGPFVNTGFKPRYVLIKDVDSTHNWYVFDTARDDTNPILEPLFPDGNYAEQGDSRPFDILSNGFKPRHTTYFNDSAKTHIYAAFAEHPFKTARAR